MKAIRLLGYGGLLGSVASLTSLACGGRVETTPTSTVPERDQVVSSKAITHPWPMVGQGPSHQSRSLTPIASLTVHRSWDVALGEPLEDNSPVIAADGTIYTLTRHALHAIASAGVKKWRVPVNALDDAEMQSPAIGPDGTIYVPSTTGLLAFWPTGEAKRTATVASSEGLFLSSPTIATDGTVYVSVCAPSDDTNMGLMAVSPEGKSRQLPFGRDLGCASTPASAEDGTLIVIWGLRRFSSGLMSVRTDGAAVHRGLLGIVGRFNAFPAHAHGLTYVKQDGTVTARTQGGAPAWNYRSWRYSNHPPAIGRDGVAYANVDPSRLAAIRLDGTVAWSDTHEEGEVALGADDTLYVAAEGHISAFAAAGNRLGDLSFDGRPSSMLAIDADGTVIFGTEDGKLHAR